MSGSTDCLVLVWSGSDPAILTHLKHGEDNSCSESKGRRW